MHSSSALPKEGELEVREKPSDRASTLAAHLMRLRDFTKPILKQSPGQRGPV